MLTPFCILLLLLHSCLNHFHQNQIKSNQIKSNLFSVIFSDTIFPIFSNAGEIVLLLALSFATFLVQNDLSTVASFADFLHRSNAAFRASKAIKDADEGVQKRRSTISTAAAAAAAATAAVHLECGDVDSSGHLTADAVTRTRLQVRQCDMAS